MVDVPVAVALGAGMVAAVNPCGFALLPAYLSFLVVGDQPPSRTRAVGRALGLTAAMTIGFVAVFGLFGLAIMPVAGSVQRHLPWFTVVFGLLLAAVGGWLLAGRQIPVPRLTRGVNVTGSVGSMVAFGVAYAIASLGCTIGPFLTIVVTSFRASSVTDGVTLFATYAGGMGLVVGVAAVAVAAVRSSLVGRLRRIGRTVPRAGGALLLAAGSYVAYYGWYERGTYRGASASDPIVDGAGTIQRWLAGGVDQVGAPVLLLFLTLVVGGVVGLDQLRRARKRSRQEDKVRQLPAGR